MSLPQIRDIIQSPLFAFGRTAFSNLAPQYIVEHKANHFEPAIVVDGVDIEKTITGERSETIVVTNNDPARASAKYVVINAKLTGGSKNKQSPWADGWQVIARELNPDGSFNEDGQLIIFFVSHAPRWWDASIKETDIKIVGRIED